MLDMHIEGKHKLKFIAFKEKRYHCYFISFNLITQQFDLIIQAVLSLDLDPVGQRLREAGHLVQFTSGGHLIKYLPQTVALKIIQKCKIKSFLGKGLLPILVEAIPPPTF